MVHTFELVRNFAGRRYALSLLWLFMGVGVGMAAAPPNDDCSTPTVVNAVPFGDIVDTSMASAAVDDPTSLCNGTNNSVWYSYTAPTTTTIEIDTIGSTYDTSLSVWEGSCGSLQLIGCDDSSGGGSDAKVVLTVRQNQTILILVDAVNTSGTLDFNVNPSVLPYGPAVEAQAVFSSTQLNPFGTTTPDLHYTLVSSASVTTFTGGDAGIFLHDGVAIAALAQSGDPTPVGGVYGEFGDAVINNFGEVAFTARIENGPADDGVFFFDGVATTAIALSGDPAPGGGTYGMFAPTPDLNDGGEIAFISRLLSAGAQNGLYLYSGGSTARLLAEGDVSPCGGDVSMLEGNRPRPFALNDAGVVAISVRGRSGNLNAVLRADPSVTAIACEGDPTPVGSTYRSFGTQPALNNLGDVVFKADVDAAAGVPGEVLVLVSGGVSTKVVASGDFLVTGELVEQLHDAGIPAIDDLGDIAGSVQLPSPASPGCGLSSGVAALFYSPAGGAGPGKIVGSGDPCPSGGTIVYAFDQLDMNAAGEIVFGAQCTSAHGLFRMLPGVSFMPAGLHTDVVGASGGGFHFDYPSINDASHVVARGGRTAIYSVACGPSGCAAPQTVVKPLDPLPAPGDSIQRIYPATLEGRGARTVFVAQVSGTGFRESLVRARGGALTELATWGTPVAGVGALAGFEEYTPKFGAPTRIGFSGRTIAFRGLTETPGGGCIEGILVARPAGITQLAAVGDPTPTGGTIADLGFPAIAGRRIVFNANDGTRECIFGADPAGTLTAIACETQAAPAPVGGTLESFSEAATINRRVPYFYGPVTGGTSSECLFARPTSGLQSIHCEGDAAPGGGLVNRIGIGGQTPLPRGAASGSGVIYIVETDSVFSDYVLMVERRGILWPVAFGGVQPAPPSIGGTLDFDISSASMRGRQVVFDTRVQGGNARSAVLRAKLK